LEGEEVPGKVIGIERKKPRPGGVEEPYRTEDGKYVLGDPAKGNKKHRVENQVYVRSLDEAATLIERGYSLRMTRSGKRPSLISPSSLRIVRT
jgi:hypothetical protein